MIGTLIEKYLKDQSKPVENQHMSFIKNGKVFVFFKEGFDPDTGSKNELQVFGTTTKAEVQDEIARLNLTLEGLQTFLTILQGAV